MALLREVIALPFVLLAVICLLLIVVIDETGNASLSLAEVITGHPIDGD